MNKKCKGINKAKGHGCGSDEHLIVRYGLCSGCWSDWLLNTPEGKKVLEKSKITRKKVKKTKDRAHIKILKETIETKRELEKRLQPIINAIVRLIDKNNGCVSCQMGWDGKPFTRIKQGGHRLSVGSNHHLRFNLWNIFLQCSQCNTFRGGEPRDYDQGLKDRYGEDVLAKACSLSLKFKDVSWTKEQIREIIPLARKIKKEIEQGKVYTRADVNKKLGIYV